jgi:hypothetical protein
MMTIQLPERCYCADVVRVFFDHIFEHITVFEYELNY